MIASPNLASKFSPSILISKSPAIALKRISIEQNNRGALDILNKFAKNKPIDNSKNVLLKYSMNPNTNPISQFEEIKEEKLEDKNVPVRKNRNFLKNLEELPTNKLNIITTGKVQYNDLPITPAKKQSLKETNTIDHE